ncbi:L-aspartate 1-decarboxylase [Lachnotalea glycerini]|jgi:aspartate 1-decarboxylase|uniref:Aspartate 1-decarboxylase n=1 Tax=Lachnotalea glycerini TaxID=1763509 RepID=A0A255IM80_9FIRM|nr:aspartate 1-decarboxylase [Lachnotalea glycerini]PXV95413.1 L-aspartate 1-decarboxylase [Lachnotalea glycerini]RDY32735.1 aspartate 1-decarboxylase [Lachnotalea glycerini]
MNLTMLKSKIHRAVVKQADLSYIGSITIDQELLEEAGILEYEKVQIVDIENGNRFETYAIAGERGLGMICLNGAAARCVQLGDHIIIMSFANMDAEEAKKYRPKVLFMDDENQIVRVTNYERHGKLADMD